MDRKETYGHNEQDAEIANKILRNGRPHLLAIRRITTPAWLYYMFGFYFGGEMLYSDILGNNK